VFIYPTSIPTPAGRILLQYFITQPNTPTDTWTPPSELPTGFRKEILAVMKAEAECMGRGKDCLCRG